MNIISIGAEKSEKGVILITGLILLLIVTLIGITSMQSVILSEKMTSNMRDTSIAFQATESALSDGERWIKSQAAKPDAVKSCSASPCPVWQDSTLSNIYKNSPSWWKNNARSYSTSIYGIHTQPYFIIQEYGFVPYELSPDARAKGAGYHYYRVTARGTGEVDTTKTMIESIYATQFN
jgi:type IV pilus assembly protein PilX